MVKSCHTNLTTEWWNATVFHGFVVAQQVLPSYSEIKVINNSTQYDRSHTVYTEQWLYS